MAGGIFGKPFALNIKCIIFSLIIMALFLYKPDIRIIERVNSNETFVIYLSDNED